MLRWNIVNCFLAFYVILLLFCSSQGWFHSTVLDRDNRYWVHWELKENETILFEVEVQAKGYVGLGLSKTGAMAGSDIVTGWVSDGVVYFQDRHALGNMLPPVDKKQDWILLEGRENDTHTVLRFHRKLRTCDDEDLEIDGSTLRLIYAYSDEDPASCDQLQYHYQRRGSRSVILLQPERRETSVDGLPNWDIRTQNYTITSDMRSVYWCTLVKGPELQEKHHIIKIQPLIQPGHESYVHHIVLYECIVGVSEELEPLLETGGHQCYHPNMPDAMSKCEGLIAAWGVGGQAMVFPENVGLPLYPIPPKYYLLEVHYDNPNFHDVTDESGFRIFYTPDLRTYDAGMFMIGATVSPRVVIPPNQPSFTVAGHLHPKCFEESMPPEGGVKILGLFLHAHLLGKHLKARHFRGNIELPPLAENANYDFNYQEFVFLEEEVQLLKGDQITVECTYDSTWRKKVTFGGLTTLEEMCLAFILYYPRIERFGCMSSATWPLIMGLTGVDLESEYFSLFKYKDAMLEYDWDNLNMSVVESAMQYSPHEVFCYSGDGHKNSVLEYISYPKKLIPFEKPNFCELQKTDEP